ncbi:hypothetical protein WJX74_007017 [Apatococcus lobatus]|uniref:Uncharacterized protein n=1 Tax=Apatococcus lobatus TaxID=904363 RepID=A0AAW1QBK1_9CHLO
MAPLSVPAKSAASQFRAAVQPAHSCRRLCRRRERRSAASHGYAYAEANTDSATLNSDADDYYSILGVTSSATDKEIKKAYHSVMRQCHPDLVGEAEGSTFATVLNDIYETLSDVHKRAAYDNIFGFDEDAINPFKDQAESRDQVFVDEQTCIGCRNCVAVSPQTFAMEDEFGRARAEKQGVDTQANLQEAIDTCPVDCISFVSPSQLALLEVTMRRLDRQDAWILNSLGGTGENVFLEASMAWEKRRASIRSHAQGWFGGWSGAAAAGAHGTKRKGERNASGSGDTQRDRFRSRHDAAVTAAAAARRWRDYQSNKRRGSQLALPSIDQD